MSQNTKEPISYTVLFIIWWNEATGKSGSKDEQVYFKNHAHYSSLPGPVKSPTTREEYDAWWAWYKVRLETLKYCSYESAQL